MIRNEDDFAAEKLDRGNFVGNRHLLLCDHLVSFFQHFSRKNLRCLHPVNAVAIDRFLDGKIDIGAFQRVVDWFGQCRRSTARPAHFEDARDFFRSYQRARGVVHGNEIGFGT